MQETIIDKVAQAIQNIDNGDNYRKQAIAAIEAMRYLVKMNPHGYSIDDETLNAYIDAALREEQCETWPLKD